MPEHYPNPDKVRAMLLAEGTMDEIGDRFGVSGMTVRNYKLGKSARARDAIALLNSEGLNVVPPPPRPFTRLTPEQVVEIRAARGAHTSRALGKKYGVKATVIRMIWIGRTYS